jgi:hypothetical protein
MLSLSLLTFFIFALSGIHSGRSKIKNAIRLGADSILSGGELGIRTPGPCNRSTVFKTAAIDHSANSPAQKYKTGLNLQTKISFFELLKITHSK